MSWTPAGCAGGRGGWKAAEGAGLRWWAGRPQGVRGGWCEGRGWLLGEHFDSLGGHSHLPQQNTACPLCWDIASSFQC